MSLCLALALAVAAQYDAPTVPDAELAHERGGFSLPGGIDVALTVDTTTAVDGAVVLRTVFRADQGTPTLSVYAPQPGQTVAAPTRTASGGEGASVAYDPRTGIQVTRTSAPTVAIGGAGAIPAGLGAVAGGATTNAGTIAQASNGALRQVTLTGDNLAITHVAGAAFGAAVANSGNDRAIDTVTSVAIDLSGTRIDAIGSSMLRVQGVAEDALRGRF